MTTKSKATDSRSLGPRSESPAGAALINETAPAQSAAAAFTPGPWRIAPKGEGLSYLAEKTLGGFAIESDDYILAVTIGDVSDLRDCEASNARLIAAAPELLAALLAGIAAATDGMWSSNRRESFVNQARAAIAKATGSQP